MYTLPNGSLQAIRANFRFSGRASACTVGGYNDHDDLVFAVGSSTSTPTPVPVITSAATASGNVGSSFSYGISATNSPISFNAVGLPTGLLVNTGAGSISGVPGVTGTFLVNLSAANSGGTGTAVLTLTINPPLPAPPVIASAATATGTVGSAFSYSITATNSPTSYNATGASELAIDQSHDLRTHFRHSGIRRHAGPDLDGNQCRGIRHRQSYVDDFAAESSPSSRGRNYGDAASGCWSFDGDLRCVRLHGWKSRVRLELWRSFHRLRQGRDAHLHHTRTLRNHGDDLEQSWHRQRPHHDLGFRAFRGLQ